MSKLHQHIPNRKTPTPQTQPLDNTQVPNNAGGYGWQVDKWTQLKRFLIIGTEGGTYYQGEGDLTRQNYDSLKACLAEDGVKTVQMIHSISQLGVATKNTPAIFALALAASADEDMTRQLAYRALTAVCRTGTHLFQFAEFVEAFRGWGRGLRRAVASWYTTKQPRDLAYQLVKYQQREGWSHADLLRLSHPKTNDELLNALFKWVLGKETEFSMTRFGTQVAVFMDAYFQLRATTDPQMAAVFIKTQRLPREVVPTHLLNSPEVWEALLDDMPMTALVRNLNKLTAVGVVAPFSDGMKKAVSQLENSDQLRKSKIHPLTLLVALKQYAVGHGERGSLKWQPLRQVIDALDGAFYAAFDNVEKSAQNVLVGIDVSGSMEAKVNGIPTLSAFEAGAALAMAYVRSHPNCEVIGFDMKVYPLTISPRMRLDDVLRAVMTLPHGGTDIGLPANYALDKKWPVDGIVQITDSETWAGNRHPTQVLEQLNRKHPVRLVNVQTTAQYSSQYQPARTPYAMEMMGFGADIPNVANLFIRGEI